MKQMRPRVVRCRAQDHPAVQKGVGTGLPAPTATIKLLSVLEYMRGTSEARGNPQDNTFPTCFKGNASLYRLGQSASGWATILHPLDPLGMS
jgi:hypothetical protein